METMREPSSALRSHPQEQIKRTQMQQPLSALLTSAAEVAHGRLEKRVGCGLKPFPHPSRPLFFFLMTSPTSHPNTVVGCLTPVLWEPAVLFSGAQGATQDSWNRTQPELTHRSCSLPAPRSSEPQSPFPRPIVITKDLLSRQNVLNRKARRKHPPHLRWEADFEAGRNG